MQVTGEIECFPIFISAEKKNVIVLTVNWQIIPCWCKIIDDNIFAKFMVIFASKGKDLRKCATI